MNFWYIEHYDASFGDDIDAKMNYGKHIKIMFIQCILNINRRVYAYSSYFTLERPNT